MKKNNVFLSVLAISGLFTSAFMLSSCDNKQKDEKYKIYELAKESGFTGTYEEWLETVKGADGQDGREIELSVEDGKIVWHYVGETTWKEIYSINDLIGPKGDTGDKGDKGDKGETGVSITKIEKTATEELMDTYTITYSDGTTSTFIVTNGKDGSDGEQGIQGVPGIDGTTPTVSINEEGYWVINDEVTEIKATGIKGDKGEQGDKGDKGEQGEAGVSITNIEKTSTSGLKDTYTITYSDGTTSTFVVTNGQDGSQGIQGEPGKDGVTPTISINDQGYWVINGVTTDVNANNGSKGDKGDTGEAGAKGDKGDTGDKGDKGEQGEKGDAGAKGDKGDPGQDGTNGKSAYELYLEAHPDYHGSLEQWLDDLVNDRLGNKEKVYHNIKFITGSDSVIPDQKVEHFYKVERPSDPIKEGYTFNGWYVDDEKWVFNGYSVTSDVTLTASWSINYYDISIDLDNGSAVKTTNYQYGSVIEKIDVPFDMYRDFDHLEDENGNLVTLPYVVKGTHTIKAVYNELNYGTIDNPLNVTESLTIIDRLPKSNGYQPIFTKEKIYVKGVVTNVIPYDIYYTITIQGEDGSTILLFDSSLEQGVDVPNRGDEIIAYGNGQNYTRNQELNYPNIVKITKDVQGVEIPKVTDPIYYNGKPQEIIKENEYYTVEGGTQTDVGNYTATLTLKDPVNTSWVNEFDGKITFSIAKGNIDVSGVTVPEVVVKYSGKENEVEVVGLPETVKANVTYYKDELMQEVVTSTIESGKYFVKVTFEPLNLNNYNAIDLVLTSSLVVENSYSVTIGADEVELIVNPEKPTELMLEKGIDLKANQELGFKLDNQVLEVFVKPDDSQNDSYNNVKIIDGKLVVINDATNARIFLDKLSDGKYYVWVNGYEAPKPVEDVYKVMVDGKEINIEPIEDLENKLHFILNLKNKQQVNITLNGNSLTLENTIKTTYVVEVDGEHEFFVNKENKVYVTAPEAPKPEYKVFTAKIGQTNVDITPIDPIPNPKDDVFAFTANLKVGDQITVYGDETSLNYSTNGTNVFTVKVAGVHTFYINKDYLVNVVEPEVVSDAVYVAQFGTEKYTLTKVEGKNQYYAKIGNVANGEKLTITVDGEELIFDTWDEKLLTKEFIANKDATNVELFLDLNHVDTKKNMVAFNADIGFTDYFVIGSINGWNQNNTEDKYKLTGHLTDEQTITIEITEEKTNIKLFDRKNDWVGFDKTHQSDGTRDLINNVNGNIEFKEVGTYQIIFRPGWTDNRISIVKVK